MEWEELAVRLSDLHPIYRLQQMEKMSKCFAMIPHKSILAFCKICNEILILGDNYMKNDKAIEAFETFLKYQHLVKKIKKHQDYKTIPSNITASFDYNLKNVAKNLNSLRTELYYYFKDIYKKTKSRLELNELGGYGDRRPTTSTIRTFVSSPSEESISYLDRKPFYRRSLTKKPKSSFQELHGSRRIVRRLKTLTLPAEVEIAFSYLSYNNNKKNIVTVGIIAGIEIDERELAVTHLIIPKQIGISDSFEVVAPEEVTTLLEEANIEIFGWIESKPCGYQTYMSSTDLHYHCGYQMNVPEAVAIVYCPNKPEFSTFNLTPDYGLPLIAQCSETGHHIHPTQPEVYMKSQHVFVENASGVCKFDLRKNTLACTYNCSCLPQLLNKKNS